MHFTTHEGTLKQAKADYATAIGAGKVERAQTQGTALGSYAASANGAQAQFVTSYNTHEANYLDGQRGIETTYLGSTLAASAAAAAAARAKALADAQALGAAQLALTTSLANSAATAAHDAAQAEATYRVAELSNRAGISTAVQFRWLQEEYEPTTLERWFVAFDQAEAQWTAAIAPAFVAYASSMAQAAAAETIAQATAANTQSLTNLAADHAYQSATEQYFEQAQEDQHDAWFDYLDDWYEQEHLDREAQVTAQTAFDAADNAAATLRSMAFDEADAAWAYDYIMSGHQLTSSTTTVGHIGRAAADIEYAADRGTADVEWSTDSAESSRDRKKNQATAEETYQNELAQIDRDLTAYVAPHERTRQAAYATAQTVVWTAEVAAANVQRTAEYAAVADFRGADYGERAAAMNALSIEFVLPWVEFQAELADARATWWNVSASDDFLALAVAKNTADTAYQAAVNPAYITWATSVAQAGSTYSLAQADADFAERTNNAVQLRSYVHKQADAERDFYVNYAQTRHDEFVRVTTERHSDIVAGNIVPLADHPGFEPVWADGANSPYNQELLTPHNADYTQRVVPADSARRMGLMSNRFGNVNSAHSAEADYRAAVAAAELTYTAAEGAASVGRTAAFAIADGQYDVDTSAVWATSVEFVDSYLPSPWSALETAKATADAGYATAMVTPVAPATVGPLQQYHTAIAQAEAEHAVATSQINAVRSQESFSRGWREALHATRESFVFYVGFTRNDDYQDALVRAPQAGAYNLVAAPSGDTSNGSSPDLSVVEGSSPSRLAPPKVIYLPIQKEPNSLGSYQPLYVAPPAVPAASPSVLVTVTNGIPEPLPPLNLLAEIRKPLGNVLTEMANGAQLSAPRPEAPRTTVPESTPTPSPPERATLASFSAKIQDRFENANLVQVVGQYYAGVREGFSDSFVDTASLIGGVLRGGKYLFIRSASLVGMDWRGAIQGVTGWDPIAREEAELAWLQQKLQEFGDSAVEWAFAEPPDGWTRLQQVAALGKFNSKLNDYLQQLNAFLNADGKELVKAILDGDLLRVAELRSHLSEELQGAIDTIASIAIQLADSTLDEVTPHNLGYLVGMIVYEAAETAAIAAAWGAITGATSGVAGVGIPVIISAKAATISAKLNKYLTKHAPKLIPKVLHALENLGDFSRQLDNAFDVVTGTTKRLEDVQAFLKHFCFARDTLVSTATGLRRIGEITAGEQVHSFDFVTGEWRLRTVTNRSDSLYSGPVVVVEAGESQIEATINHPFWVLSGHELSLRATPSGFSNIEDQGLSLSGRWVNSHELLAGDIIVSKDGRQLTIKRITQRYEAEFPVSNLTIGEFHNFAVGPNAVLVHNHSICPKGEEWLEDALESGDRSWDYIVKLTEGFVNRDEVLERLGRKHASNSGLVARIQGKLNLYPKVIDPRTGRHIQFPSGIKGPVDKSLRVAWDSKMDRAALIAEWHRRGYATPRGGWDKFDIHHIQPREFGGTNDFWNLVPVERNTHQELFNEFWREFTGL